jgi:hypothetical protein
MLSLPTASALVGYGERPADARCHQRAYARGASSGQILTDLSRNNNLLQVLVVSYMLPIHRNASDARV